MKRTKKQAKLPQWLTGKTPVYILFITAIVIYANTIFNDFALDDAIVITDNSFTQQGLAGIPDIFRYDSFRGFFKEEGKSSLVAGGRYRPFSIALFALEYAIFGQSAWVFHFFNVIYFAILGMVIYWVLLKALLTGIWSKKRKRAALIAFVTAALFIIHPIHTEVVANIKGRDEIIALMGVLLGIYFLINPKGGIWSKAVSFLFFLVGFLSKESALPFVVLVPFIWFLLLGRSWYQSIKSSWPVFLAAGLFLIIRLVVLGIPELSTPTELMNNPFLTWNGNGYVPMTFSEKYGTIFYTLLRYVELLIFPHPLTHDYYPLQIPKTSITHFFSLLSIIIHISMLILAVYHTRKRPLISLAIWIYLLSLSIVSNLLFPIGTNMSERFLFIPSLGFVLILAALVGQLWINRRPTWILLLLLIIGVFYTTKTIMRNSAWKDNFTLFSTDVLTSPNSAKLRNALGGELSVLAASETDKRLKNNMLTEADVHLKKAIELHPTYANAYLILGNVNYYLENYEASVEYLIRAQTIKPNYPEANRNLQIVYREAGKFYGEQKGDLTKSINFLLKSYELNPQDYESLRLLGVAYGIGQDHSQAVKYFTKALEIKPNDADAHYNLGLALLNSGNETEGSQYLRKAIELDPEVTKRYGQ